MLLPSVARWTCLLLAVGTAQGPALAATETHSNLQAVTSNGTSAWNGAFPFTIRGVLLCNPEEMLDFTPNFLPWNGGANAYQLGAEWQVTIQAVDPSDHGGTTCWMGQSYGNMPWLHSDDLSYSNEAWVSEILRLNCDPSNLHPFKAGDLVEMTVRRAEFYGGKRNINEAHDIDPGLRPLVAPDHAEEHLHERGLARPVGSKEAETATLGDGEGYIVHGHRAIGVGLVDAVHRNRVFFHG